MLQEINNLKALLQHVLTDRKGPSEAPAIIWPLKTTEDLDRADTELKSTEVYAQQVSNYRKSNDLFSDAMFYVPSIFFSVKNWW